MRFFINGVEGGGLRLIKGADLTLNVLFLTDAGAPVPLTGTVVADLQGFVGQTRTDTPDYTYTVTPAAGGAAGYGTVTIQDTDSILRGTVYLWGRVKSDSGSGSGTLVQIGSSPSTLQVV